MKLLHSLIAFKRDDSGALTIDWALMVASIVALGQVVMTVVGSSLTGLGDAIVVDQRKGTPG
jgi:Flp pilus assembly pilin Flp